MHWIVVFLTIIFMPMIQSQVWQGGFRTTAGCAQASCCCPSSDIVVIQTGDTTLALNLTLAGTLCMGMTTLYQTNLPKPDGYSLTMTVSIVTFTVSLNSDSTVLTIASTLGSQCTVVANRIGTIAATVSTTQDTNTNNGQATTTQSHNSATQKYVTPSVLFYLSFVCLVVNH